MGSRSKSSSFKTDSGNSSKLATVLALLTAGLGACTDHTPARIQFTADTTTINTRLASDVGLRVLDAHGRPVERARVGYAVAPESLLWVMPNGKFGCLGNGVGTVTVTSGAAAGTTHVECRLISSLGPRGGFNVVRLIVGDPPVPIPADPRDEHGMPMDRVRFPVTVADSTIVELKDGMLRGVKIGSSFVSLTAGGKSDVGLLAEVYERIVDARAIGLGAGDVFTQPLAPGNYQLDMRFTSGGVAASWTGTQCPDTPAAPDVHVWCIVGPGASLTLRNPSRSPAQGHMSLMRTAAKRRRVARL